MSENSEPNSTNTEVVEGGILTYRKRPLVNPTDKPIPVLIMIHGYGANDGDVFELVTYIDPSVLIIAPRAPYRYNDDPRGNFKWTDTEMSELAVPAKFSDNVQKILQLIEQLPAKEGVIFDKIFVGGFSQGAIISYALVSESPDLFAGVIAHSGPFNPEIEIKLRNVSLEGKPFFIAHGRTDQWVNIEQGRNAAQLLKELGAAVNYQEYDFMHETSPESRRDLANWLSARL